MQLYALGEITYDIIFKDGKPIDSKVGGSVLNTAVSSARLGMPVTMVATCATDEIGLITQKYLTTNGINTKSITVYKGTSRIALAFLDEQNNAKYSFYNGLNYEELKLSFPTSTENGFVLFGSSFGINPQIRTDLVKYLKRAKESGNLIYYDPNFRPSQLIGNDSAKEWIIENIRMADIVKGSNEDFLHLFNAKTSQEAFDAVKKINPQVILIVTANKDGADLFTSTFHRHYDVPQIKPVSTIGAGDTFSAGILYGLHNAKATKENLQSLTESQWDNALNYAITFATEVCMSYENYITLK